ncbi:MAG: TraB/GumN family protein [Desulfohalobiaceae bacterium]
MSDESQAPESTPEAQETIPATTRRISLPDKEVYLLGTAHVSQQSVSDVASLIQAVRPDSVCVELCHSRYQSMVQPETWRKMDVFRVIKENKALFLLVQLLMSAFYRKIARKLGVTPGAEMLEGVTRAEEVGAEVVLADRDVTITLKRVWRHLSFWQKLKLILQALTGAAFSGELEAEDIEKLKEKDQLQVIMDELGQSFPEIKKRLIGERDVYLAQKIREAPGETVVAVVGAGHAPGIETHLFTDHDLAPLMEIPPPSIIPKILKWGVPVAIVLLIGLGFLSGGAAESIHSLGIWILMNGIFTALAVTLVLPHPLTIVVGFLAAPLTSLNPTIAAGWVAGLVQAWFNRPKVRDLEDLPLALGSLKKFWGNPAIKVLLVVVLANIGSSIGTFVAGSWIASKFI